MNITIETGIPLPQQQRPKGRKSTYPFADMKQGDSFFVPGGKKITQRVQSSAFTYGTRTNVRFAVRVVPGEGVRVWHMGPRTAAPMSVAAE